MYRVLVTGVGGDLGQSVCKTLRSTSLIASIIGGDIHEEHPGKFLCDHFAILPKCNTPEYLRVLSKLVHELQIDLIVPCVELELRMLLERELLGTIGNTPVIMANRTALEVGFDKLATATFLRNENLPYPETVELAHANNPKFPLILKSRRGAGSKQLHLLRDPNDLAFYGKKHPDFILQEYVGSESEEYTCAVFKSQSGELRTIIFNRTMADGFSNFGVVVRNESIENLLTKISKGLKLRGAINVQLRMTDRGPIVFEINPRLSSTVYFRHQMGFRDLVWSIEDALSLPLSAYTEVMAGKKFYRGTTEYFE